MTEPCLIKLKRAAIRRAIYEELLASRSVECDKLAAALGVERVGRSLTELVDLAIERLDTYKGELNAECEAWEDIALDHTPMWWNAQSKTLTIQEDHRIKLQWRGPNGLIHSGSVPVRLVLAPGPRPSPPPATSSIPLDALQAIAQGEPLDEVAGDYGVPLDVVRAAAPCCGRKDDEGHVKAGIDAKPDLHPRTEACIHCATPERLASTDPVIDCPREECPAPRSVVRLLRTSEEATARADEAVAVLTRLVELRKGNGCVEGWVDRWEAAWAEAGQLLTSRSVVKNFDKAGESDV